MILNICNQGAGKRPQPIFPSVYYVLALLLLI